MFYLAWVNEERRGLQAPQAQDRVDSGLYTSARSGFGVNLPHAEDLIRGLGVQERTQGTLRQLGHNLSVGQLIAN